jgi:hypothetical protein
MNLQQFSDQYDLVSKKEMEKVSCLAFYHLQVNNQPDFLVGEVSNWFESLNFPKPNTTRLERNLSAQTDFTRGSRTKSFKLHAKKIKALREAIPDIQVKPTEVESDGSILPDSLLEGKRSYIQMFGRQINSAYTNNIFDGCAVLMRRMVEVCLIHTYENLKIDNQISLSPGRFKDLKEIIKDAISNPDIKLTPDSKDCLDEFRVLGNLSAHQLYYNCRPEEIKRVKGKFRLLIEELFNKAGKKVEK